MPDKRTEMEEKKRLDAALVARGLASGREKAKELIAAGHVQVNGKIIGKASHLVGAEEAISCDAGTQRYVGRGGYKLEKALEIWDLELTGKTALDVGASTGGFTDCMLQHGAAKVYAVDVGHGQLHDTLRADPRVCVMEGMDMRQTERIRDFVAENAVQFCSIDVSFISVQAVFPAAARFLREDAEAVCLIKPQFEAGRQAVGKNGVVRDPKAHRQVLRDAIGFFAGQGWPVQALSFSPITGGEGNIEYLALLRRDGCAPLDCVEQTVQQAWDALGTQKR